MLQAIAGALRVSVSDLWPGLEISRQSPRSQYDEWPRSLVPLTSDDPDRIGPFGILGLLGDGQMGRVYLGWSATGRLVAVKTVRPEYAEEAGFRALFAGEIAAARRVSGMFTAAVVAADPEAMLPWLATVYVPAPSLRLLVDIGGPLPPAAVRWLAAGCAEALESIHETGLVHGDLKPSNVLVALDGPRVIDFGMARAATRLVMAGGMGGSAGTPAFMAPEQARDLRQLTAASDVFSLGATLLFAASGRAPYSGETVMDVLVGLVTEPPDLSRAPRELVGLLSACLDHNPASRPTPAELLADVVESRHDLGEVGPSLPPAAAALIEEHRHIPPAAASSAVPDETVLKWPDVGPRPHRLAEPESPPAQTSPSATRAFGETEPAEPLDPSSERPAAPATAIVSTPSGRVIGVPEGRRLVFGRGPEVDLTIGAGRGLSRRAGVVTAMGGGALITNISHTHALYVVIDSGRIRLPRIGEAGDPVGGWFVSSGAVLVGSRVMLDEGLSLRVSAPGGSVDAPAGESKPRLHLADPDSTLLPVYLDPRTKLFTVALLLCRPWLTDPTHTAPLPQPAEIARAALEATDAHHEAERFDNDPAVRERLSARVSEHLKVLRHKIAERGLVRSGVRLTDEILVETLLDHAVITEADLARLNDPDWCARQGDLWRTQRP